MVVFFILACTAVLYVTAKAPTYNWEAQMLSVMSQATALFGTVLLSLTFVLAGRFRWLEKVFGGLDIVYKLHHTFGAVSFILLLHHPLLLIVRSLPNIKLAMSFILPLSNIANLFGTLSLACLTALLVLTLFIKLPYHLWKATHEWLGVSLLFAALHVYLVNSDVVYSLPLRVWMLGWIAVGLLAFAYKRFLYAAFAHHVAYTLQSMQSHGDILILTLTTTQKPLQFECGQFVFVQWDDAKIGSESHPFSIASKPGDAQLVLWCKNLGDYTARLAQLPVGARGIAHGPHGTFFETMSRAQEIIGVAGGIGITPFLSVSGIDWQSQSKKMVLFHSMREPTEFPLETITNAFTTPTLGCTYIPHITSQQGRLSAQQILSKTADKKSARFFLCGPAAMMESLRTQLLDNGIRPSQIIFEDFALNS